METHIRNGFLFKGLASPAAFAEIVKTLSIRRVFVVLDGNVQNSTLDNFMKALVLNMEVSGTYRHDGAEPSTDVVDTVKSVVSRYDVDAIIGIGGGSTMDLMKAVSVLRHLQLSAAEAQGATFEVRQKLFSIAIPTTSGSGSEATKSAVLINLGSRLKRGINNPRVIPDVALLIPGILDGIPDKAFVASVFDGFTHALESALGKSGSEEVKEIAKNSLRIFLKQFVELANNQSLVINEDILEASYFAGVSICNSETGPVHAISYPLSEYCDYGHGEAVGLLLPKVLRVYLDINLDFQKNLESLVGMPPHQLIDILETVYARYVSRPENLKPISDIPLLAARSLQLLGAISNSPIEWNESLSMNVLEQCWGDSNASASETSKTI
jgi:alcohol dehydrogenase class IV